jgi:hypothetical protein
MQGKTFYIVPGGDENVQIDLIYKEYTKYVASYIIFKGGIETEDTLNADVCILLNYGVNESTPIFKNISFSDGDVISKPVDQYRRYIDIYAHNNHNIDEMLWKTNIESIGKSNDLRYLFPYMMYAGKDFLGIDSKYKLKIYIWDYYVNEAKNILMKMVAAGNFRSEGMIALPKVSSMSPSARQSGLYIIAIQKDKNKTVVLFEYFGNDKVRFTEELILDQGDGYRKLKPIIASIDLTKKLKKNTRYFTIEFDALEMDGPIDVIDNESGMYWKGIEIK